MSLVAVSLTHKNQNNGQFISFITGYNFILHSLKTDLIKSDLPMMFIFRGSCTVDNDFIFIAVHGKSRDWSYCPVHKKQRKRKCSFLGVRCHLDDQKFKCLPIPTSMLKAQFLVILVFDADTLGRLGV